MDETISDVLGAALDNLLMDYDFEAEEISAALRELAAELENQD